MFDIGDFVVIDRPSSQQFHQYSGYIKHFWGGHYAELRDVRSVDGELPGNLFVDMHILRKVDCIEVFDADEFDAMLNG